MHKHQCSKIDTTNATSMVIYLWSGYPFLTKAQCAAGHLRRNHSLLPSRSLWLPGCRHLKALRHSAGTPRIRHRFHHDPKLGLPTSHRNDHWKGWTHITSETRRFSHSYSMGWGQVSNTSQRSQGCDYCLLKQLGKQLFP